MVASKNTPKTKKKSASITRREYGSLARIMKENDCKSFNLVAEMAGDEGEGIWDTEQRAYIDARNLKNLFYSEAWPYTIIDLIAMKISNQRLVIYKDTPLEDGQVEAKPVPNHPYQKTLDNPNPYQDYHTWMYCIVADLITVGNGIIWKGMTGLNLWQIPSDEVTLDFDQTSTLVRYRRLSMNDMGAISTISEFMPKDVIHVKRPNPNSLYWGLSPFVPGRKSVLFDRYSTEYLNNYYIKGTTPGLTLEMTAEANEKNAVRMLKSFEIAYSGRRAQRRTMLLPKGVVAKNTATTLADQQLKDYIDKNIERILALLKVPKHEVGLQTAGSLGSEEYKIALTNFWSATLKPTMRMIAASMTSSLKENLGEGYYLGFDLSDVETLKDDMLKKSAVANSMVQTHTLNEIRQEIFEKAPVEGGDVVASLKPAPSPFALSLSQQSTETKSTEVDSVIETPESNAADRMIKAHRSWFDSRNSKISKETKEPIKKMVELSANIIMDQGKVIIKMLQDNLKIKAVGDPDDDYIKKKIQEGLASFEKEWVAGYSERLNPTIDFGYDLALDVPFAMPAEAELVAIGDRTRGKRHDVINARGIKTFKGMNKTTTDETMEIVKEGIKKSQTIQQITNRIAEKYTNVDNVMYRAERIARTEVLTASSLGQAAAMENARELMPDLQKMWLSSQDERVRGNPDGLYAKSKTDHWHLHGQIVDSDEPFVDEKSGKKLWFPRDPSADAGEVINCFIASTNVISNNSLGAFQRHYSGPIIVVNFASGNKLTGTPNHPILTSKGWIGLGQLAKGNQVFKASGFDNSFSSGNTKNIKSTIGKAFEFFVKTSTSLVSKGRGEDFHGDGTTQDVNVVCIKGELQNRNKTTGLKKCINFGFSNTNLAKSNLLCNSRNTKPICRIGNSHGGIGCGDLKQSSFLSELRPFESLGLASIPEFDTRSGESCDDSGSRNAKCPGDLENGLSLIDVSVDYVDSVDVLPKFSGHVYNLHTKDGYYLAENYIVHNCRCTFITLPKSDMDKISNDSAAQPNE